MGIPMVITKLDPSPFCLEEGKNVLYCEAHNSLDLAKKVNYLAKEPKVRKDMKDYNISIRDNLSWTKAIKDSKIIDLLRKNLV